jgi:hypothetical protein
MHNKLFLWFNSKTVHFNEIGSCNLLRIIERETRTVFVKCICLPSQLSTSIFVYMYLNYLNIVTQLIEIL